LPTPLSGKRVVIVFIRFGPYHVARLKGAIEAGHRCGWDVHGLEVTHMDSHYSWKPLEFEEGLPITTVVPNAGPASPPGRLRRLLFEALDALDPTCVAVPGYGGGLALTALAWCRVRERAAVLMSESKRNDAFRWAPVEVLKCWLVRRYDAGLVGGQAQRAYLARLGLPQENILLGYDAVDNAYFEKQSDAARSDEEHWREQLNITRPFILASCRFLRRKNVRSLVEAYAVYRARIGSEQAWDLTVIGDGNDRGGIEHTISRLELEKCVHLPGFRQLEELPAWYGLAKLFVHVPLREQWGLVVNEAMASATPVLVSATAGASELVREGVDGWIVDARSTDALAQALIHAHMVGDAALRGMGYSAREHVQEWGPERFATGLMSALGVALERDSRRDSRSRLVGRLLAVALTVSAGTLR
jgi:1,2-diacylglycerol 3-alpha-glucosyltransferase